ncbi:hypothetical protein SDC9_179428 [bioreactor metagenome]|uniref:Uncharacterized protein n=1 Tax=bioreactor metagenome TaxID=1076179 RepID=A0A645H834_9ZZZZ
MEQAHQLTDLLQAHPVVAHQTLRPAAARIPGISLQIADLKGISQLLAADLAISLAFG